MEKEARGAGELSPELSKRWRVFYPSMSLSQEGGSAENSSTSSRGYSLADNIPRVAENGIFI